MQVQSKKKIIIVGDSVTYGHGCSDREYYFDHANKKPVGQAFTTEPPSQYCWPSLLSQRFPNLEIVNLARSGYANDVMTSSLINYINTGVLVADLVIFQATYSDRMAIASFEFPGEICSWGMTWKSRILEHKNTTDAKKSYMQFLYNEKVGVNRTIQSSMTGLSIANLINAKFAFSIPKGDTAESQKIFDRLSSNRIQSLHGMMQSLPGKWETCLAVDGHPNEAGHEHYLNNHIIPMLNKLEILC